MTLISVVTACFNEEENVEEVYRRVKAIFENHPQYSYEHIFIDNASTDKTVPILKALASKDKNIKIIINARNFGHIRSPFYGLMQAKGQAVISLVCDLQDPPELINDFIRSWEQGFKIVVGVKESTTENRLMAFTREFYYKLIAKIASTRQIKNYTGFGLYDIKVIEALKLFKDPYPYFRGIIAEIGFDVAEIKYHQPPRHKGFTKNNLFSLYDMAILGMTSYSKLPMRIATIIGFICASLSLLFAVIFFILKLIFWNHFIAGTAPILIGLFFFTGVQLFFIGILGEYILSIQTHVQQRPLVIVKETVNL